MEIVVDSIYSEDEIFWNLLNFELNKNERLNNMYAYKFSVFFGYLAYKKIITFNNSHDEISYLLITRWYFSFLINLTV